MNIQAQIKSEDKDSALARAVRWGNVSAFEGGETGVRCEVHLFVESSCTQSRSQSDREVLGLATQRTQALRSARFAAEARCIDQGTVYRTREGGLAN